LKQDMLGMHFASPIGLAAGFDKNGHLPRAFEALGFGFTEVGSITAQPSPGNSKPRMFRLPLDHALVNRMGLNNDGASVISARLKKNAKPSIPVGINIAKTHDPRILGAAALRDYVGSYTQAVKVADYITVNISCPNTEEGKTFEDPASLQALLVEISNVRKTLGAHSIPLFVKFSADLPDADLAGLIAVCESNGVDGYVAVNTSSLRVGLSHTEKGTLMGIGKGGLSGPALLERAENTIKRIRNQVPSGRLIIGVGGVDSSEAAIRLLKAGASLLQLYTGLVFEGPRLVSQINTDLSEYLQKHGFKSVMDLHALPHQP
jgi:dihydroorotate dehydrogenase